ncbi:hypothetical protein NHX12_023738 [Muraenolepis orangiensis]|uniref:Uncharacterized protein n=1 Tax=Muraenolepis orangiensis TaxID=630683 RepID=A0A9Q0EL10_9TELE|nr:hypothetical protein NHX12_023738 [Muraenolepis orangiensis]
MAAVLWAIGAMERQWEDGKREEAEWSTAVHQGPSSTPEVEKVNCVIETGITVREMFVQVQPLMLPATKVILSNVPPFITDEFLSRELSRHGKLVSPMKKMLSGSWMDPRFPLLRRRIVCQKRFGAD